VLSALSALEEKKAVEPIVLDVRKLTSMTDYYVLATSLNAPHLKALAQGVSRALKDEGTRPFRKAGTPDSQWVALDYVDFVVHLFSLDARRYYDLESLWNDAPRVTRP